MGHILPNALALEFEIKPWAGVASTTYVVLEYEHFIAEFATEDLANAYVAWRRSQRTEQKETDMLEVKPLELPCHCEIDDQYLPLNGGERMVRCPHAGYIVKGTRRTIVEFEIIKEEKTNGGPEFMLKKEEDDE
jgi:hypothetical protein